MKDNILEGSFGNQTLPGRRWGTTRDDLGHGNRLRGPAKATESCSDLGVGAFMTEKFPRHQALTHLPFLMKEKARDKKRRGG